MAIGRYEFANPQDEFDVGTYCLADPAGSCDAGTRCGYFDQNPDFDVMSFDSVGSACISILQCFTFDTWTVRPCTMQHGHVACP